MERADVRATVLPERVVLARQYVELLLQARRSEAFDLILQAAESGLSVEDVYVDVLQPALYEVGRMWQCDEIDIAVEHYCTAATQLLMAKLFPYAANRKSNSMRMIGCCIGSELHELGMRMVCDTFEFQGWDTYFMGAISPGPSVVAATVAQQPDLVCLSATMPFGVSGVKKTIAAIRREMGDHGPRIMVGGLAFLLNPNLAAVVGADATARDARDAAREAKRIVGRDAA